MKDKIIEEVLMLDKDSKTELMTMKIKWVNKEMENNKEEKIIIKMKDKISEEDLMKAKKVIKNN